MTAADEVDARAEIDQIRRRVINVVGHELRTPITTLRGLADLLDATDDPEARATLHDALRRTAKRAESLLDDLLVAAGVTTALPVGEPEPTPVSGAAYEAWHLLGCAGDPTITGDADAVVLARPGVVRRALVLLVDNAVKYGTGPVGMSAARDGSTIVLEVTNDAEPLPVPDLELGFEPFYRGERAVTLAPGLGLGLAVARALARQHGGDVELRQPAPGSVVARLVLPAA